METINGADPIVSPHVIIILMDNMVLVELPKKHQNVSKNAAPSMDKNMKLTRYTQLVHIQFHQMKIPL